MEECILHFHAENSMNEGVDDAERKSLYLLQVCHAAAGMWFSVTHTVEVLCRCEKKPHLNLLYF